MKQKLITGMAAALLFLSAPSMVQAEIYSGGSGWNVDFTGEELNSSFKSADINDAISRLQPGDTVNISLEVKNTSTYESEWYMTNEVLQSLEDSQRVANGGAYTYVLCYYDPQGVKETIFSSEAVGGETSGVPDEGLHQATNTLEDFFYLDYLAPGETGKVTLTVNLDGETQGNAYQDTVAKLQMNFAVEPLIVDEDEITEDGRKKVIAKRPVFVKTGDDNTGFITSMILMGAGVVILILAIVKLRFDKKKEKEGA